MVKSRAIHAYCTGCHFKRRAKQCKATQCPLHPFRHPTEKGKDNPRTRRQAIRKHCLECCNGSAHEVQRCTVAKCALYPFRAYNGAGVYKSARQGVAKGKQEIDAGSPHICRVSAGKGIHEKD